MLRATPVLLGVGAAMGLSACAIKSDRLGLAGFAGAAATVKNETDDSFVQANQIARAAAIDTFVRTNRPGLSEDAFHPKSRPHGATRWAILPAMPNCSPLLPTRAAVRVSARLRALSARN